MNRSKLMAILRGAATAVCAVAAFVQVVSAQSTLNSGVVTTIAGEFAGDVDGDNTVSLLNTPSGLTIGPDGLLYIADRNNHKIKTLTVGTDVVRTFLQRGLTVRLNAPTAVTFDVAGNMYVANAGDGTIERFNRFGNPDAAAFAFASGVSALTVGPDGRLWVGQSNGRVAVYATVGARAGELDDEFSVPGAEVGGLAFITARRLAISDARQHVIWTYDTIAGTNPELLAGRLNAPGYLEGRGDLARFSAPRQIATAPNGNIVVADNGNHRVRVVTCDGNTLLLYGIDPAQWIGGGIPPYPGWLDGAAIEAEARLPFGVTAATDGTVFTTEQFYHIIREVSAYTFPTNGCAGEVGSGDGGNGSTNRTVAPALDLTSGYFPMGVTVNINNAGQYIPGTRFFYTLNGSDPTTNSPSVTVDAEGRAQIVVRNPQVDLSSLRVVAGIGTNLSTVVSGVPVSLPGEVSAQILVPPRRETGNFIAGAGQRLIVPVVMNVRPGFTLRSLGFTFEVTPRDGAPAIVAPRRIHSLPMPANAMIRVVAASTNGPTVVDNSQNGRLHILYSLTAGTFSVNNFAVVAMVGIDIPPNATPGQRYAMTIRNVSGSVSEDTPAELQVGSAPDIVIGNPEYLVGDASPRWWYNAGDFGDNRLDASDADAVRFAVLGFRDAYAGSDLYDAMDSYFVDAPPFPGGDRTLTFDDWDLTYKRYFGTREDYFVRAWRDGARTARAVTQPAGMSAQGLMRALAVDDSAAWSKDVTMSVGNVPSTVAGAEVNVPVYLHAREGVALSGLMFSAEIVPVNGFALTAPVRFVPASGVTAPTQNDNGTPDGLRNDFVTAAWLSGRLTPAVSGRVLLGNLRVTIPASAGLSSSYRVKLGYAGGSTGSLTEPALAFQRVNGSIGLSANQQEAFSEEWKATFFADSAVSAAADADGDGLNNYEEFLAGLNPLEPNWRVQAVGGLFTIRWAGEWGQTYEVQRSADLKNWTPAAPQQNGANGLLQFSEPVNANGGGNFYRVVRISSAQ